MTRFVEDPSSGDPIFATNTAVLELVQGYSHGDEDPFMIHRWSDLVERT
jgi:hypothetical protein